MALSEAEELELLDLLEAERRHAQATNIMAFARAIQIPGAPPPSEMSDAAAITKNPAWKAPEGFEDVEFYSNMQQPAAHHDLILAAVQDLIEGKLIAPDGVEVDGLVATLPPGAAKSSYLSMVLPAWVMGRKPNYNVICASYSQELSDRFSKRVRSITSSPEYAAIFPDAQPKTGDGAVRAWSLSNGSEYRSTGVTAGVQGFRADLLVADDLIASREDAESPVIRNKTWSALNDDLYSRSKGYSFKIILVNTRYHEDDHIGRTLGVETYKGQSGHWQGADGRRWYIINLPRHAEFDDDPLGRERGAPLWPEVLSTKEGDRLRADRTPSGIRRYASMHQQRPAPNEGAILLRSYWRPWGKLVDKGGEWINDKEPPEFITTILSYDTAIEAGEENDYSAATFWGIFEATVTLPDKRQVKQNHAMLFGAWRERIPAAELLAKVEGHIKRYKPDLVLVEKRASGAQLIQELKRRRWPVRAWLPKGRPGSLGKVPRANAIVNVLEQGCVWYYPVHHSVATTPPQAVIDECAAFPNGAYADLTDTVTQFLSWARTFQLIQLPTDPLSLVEEDEMRDRQNVDGMEGRRLYARPASHGVGKTKPLIEGKRRLYGR